MPENKFLYGGQAVIEGVMIRGQRFFSVAVRHPEGTIHSTSRLIHNFYIGRLRRIPLFRGIVVLVETLVAGMWALSYSANVNLENEDQEIGRWGMALTFGISLMIGIGLFFLTPLFIARSLDSYLSSDLMSNFVEGIIRLAIFLAYLIGISSLKDIRRVFAYHGAEHMTVKAHEASQPLNIQSIRRFSTAHPRCGTAFLMVVLVMAIIIFSFLGRPNMTLSVLSRVILLPVIAGVSYELIRFSGAHYQNRLVRGIMWPSLALQSLTTRKPDDQQIEVAIHAMEIAMAADKELEPLIDRNASPIGMDGRLGTPPP